MMDPKFQSSFIPKGPVVSATTNTSARRKTGGKSFLSFIALVLFTISILLAVGLFGYKFYLNNRISRMTVELDIARTSLEPETIQTLARLSDRISSTQKLIGEHGLLTPLFKSLETSTPKTVRFNSFQYSMTEQGIELLLSGEARGYAALAVQADVFTKSQYFINPIFSDLSLNDKGDIVFSFSALVDPSLVSYSREVERIDLPTIVPVATSTNATST